MSRLLRIELLLKSFYILVTVIVRSGGDLFNDPAINGGDETWQFYSTTLNEPTYTASYLQRGFQKLDDPYLNFWDGLQGGKGLFVGIRDCNIFLENIENTVDLDSYERDRWIAEVKFLKAYYHYYLLKCYGPIPIINENLPVSASPEQVAVYRDKVDDVVAYVNDLILEALPDLPDYKDMVISLEGGRVDKQIALAVRAEMLVMAASPLFNGNTEMAGLVDNRGTVLFNQTYDPEKWKIAADACKEAIESCHSAGKKLYTEIEPITLTQDPVFQLQTMLRQVVCERWNCELIWGGTNSQCNDRSNHSTPRVLRVNSEVINTINGQWAPTIKTVESFYTSNGVPMNEDKEWNKESWYAKRYELRPEPSSGDEKYLVKEGQRTCYMHYNREPRFYASISFDQGIYYGNGKTEFESCNYTNFLNLGWSGFQGGSSYSITGYSPKKNG
ncbi:RagB/SusD family nutrient uptake outer membrane protein [Parabacteroides faecis]|uniref:RagB/SusD family nutrient uptake outer membrane protein n=1 Tax=Parabacteroides faecis TaxID=1217282 RepID=UPI0021642862|nr:RagB/SusD family nutrient uptake outer membrane protein [Parabacteroides faecis]UVQ47365.1 RagB/SusD family nutrient uptake outer membrane protein [Parabacteroides faecis]